MNTNPGGVGTHIHAIRRTVSRFSAANQTGSAGEVANRTEALMLRALSRGKAALVTRAGVQPRRNEWPGWRFGLSALVAFWTCAALAGLVPSSATGGESLRAPVRVALMPSGHLLVTDIRLYAVVEWNPRQDRVVRMLSIPGKPVGIAWGWGRIFVGNDTTRSVEVYNRSGRLMYTLGEAGQIGRPSDIAVDSKRKLVFVSDAKGGRVLVYDQRGALLRTLPAPGETPLFQPTGLTVDPVRGEVLVSDFGKAGSFSTEAWVRIYDYDGNYLDGISGKAQADYGFSRPEGLAVNKQGLIYLVDSLRSQVLVFDRATLQGVALLGEAGTEPGKLLLPVDAVIDEKTNDLYVTNNRHGTVKVFEGQGLSP